MGAPAPDTGRRLADCMAQREPLVRVRPRTHLAESGALQQGLEILRRVLVAVLGMDALAPGEAACAACQCTAMSRLASRCISMRDSASRHQDRMSQWILELLPRRGYYRTLVAIANKNARIVWALLAKNDTLRPA